MTCSDVVLYSYVVLNFFGKSIIGGLMRSILVKKAEFALLLFPSSEGAASLMV